jgi:hypothetical protein
MGEAIEITAPVHEDNTSSHNLSAQEPSCTSPPPQLSSPKDLLVDEFTASDSASGVDELTLTSDLISSSYIAPSSDPHATNIDEPILVSDSRDIRSALSAVADRSLHPSVRAARRLQRQLNAQMRVTRSQLESISAKVEEMISSEEQCNVASPSSLSATPSRAGLAVPMEADEGHDMGVGLDEGYFDGGEDGDEMAMERLRLTFRKASDNPGIRKNIAGGDLMFARPRMRKKIMRRRRPGDRPTV